QKGKLELNNWASLWALFALITVRRCCKEVRFHTADKRDHYREVSQEQTETQSAEHPAREAASKEPTPEEVNELVKTVREHLTGCDEREKSIILDGLQGIPSDEISDLRGVSKHAVEVVLTRAVKKLEQIARQLEEQNNCEGAEAEPEEDAHA